MNKKLFLVIASALLGCFGGSLSAEPGKHQHHAPTAEVNHTDGEHHHHQTIVIPEGQPVPQVDLIVHQDDKKGWNLEIKLENFVLAPEQVNQANQPNEGHAHLFVNGEKITRIYGDWYYLADLPPGEHEIKISLNTNSHEFLMFAGQTIEDSEIITVK